MIPSDVPKPLCLGIAKMNLNEGKKWAKESYAMVSLKNPWKGKEYGIMVWASWKNGMKVGKINFMIVYAHKEGY